MQLKMSIKLKLRILGAIALASLGLLFAINTIGDTMVEQATNAKTAALEADVYVLEARRSEKDFLARKKMDYVERVKLNTQKAIKQLEYLLTEDPEARREVEEGINLIKQYQKRFLTVADLVQSMGLTEKVGLRGKLRSAIHEAEEVINTYQDDKLLAAMLMLRRREKDFIIRGDMKYLGKFNKDMAKMHAKVDASYSIPEDGKAAVNKLLDIYTKSFHAYVDKAQSIANGMKSFTATAHKLEPVLSGLAKTEIQKRAERKMMVDRATQLVSLFAALVLIGGVISLIRSIIGPLDKLQHASREVADGNYDACDKHKFNGELELLREDIVSMVSNLKASMDNAAQKEQQAIAKSEEAAVATEQAHAEKERVAGLLEKISQVAVEVASITDTMGEAVQEMTSHASEISRGTEIQAERVEETSTAITQMNSTVMEVAKNASHAAEGAGSARSMVDNGVDVIKQVENSSRDLSTRSGEMKSSLDVLGQKVDEIGSVMQVIDDIADQTNLLALNAAIEAARAGEAGRGFAVVADEVRKLAEKTMTATKEVADAVIGIQQGTRENIKAMDETADAVSKSTELTCQAGELLSKISEVVTDTSHQVTSIATAAEEQSAASEQINAATDEVNQITIETAQGIRKSVAAINTVAELAKQLQEIVKELR